MKDSQSNYLHSRPEMATSYLAPRTAIEQAIAEVWQETLGVSQVGVIDNFFKDLDGSSLMATQLVSRLRDRFRVEIPLRRFFDGPTIAELAEVIIPQQEGEVEIPQVEEILQKNIS